MRNLMFMNPRRKRRSSRRKSRVYRNPRHLSAATKRKISAALKRKNRKPMRKASKSVARRSFGKGSHYSAAMRRKISLAVKRANAARRGGSSVATSRRSVSRRRSSGGGVSVGSSSLSIRSLFNEQNIMLGAGVAAAGLVTGYVFKNYSAKLPGLVDKTTQKVNTSAVIAYGLVIPIGAGLLLKKASPKFRPLAQGLILGGLASLLSSLFEMAQQKVASTPAATASTGEYLNAGGSIPAALPNAAPSYGAINTFGDSPYNSESAFQSAW